MNEVFIVSAVRTPLGSFGGALKDVPAPMLGAVAVRAAVDRSGVADKYVSDLIMGCVLQAGLGQAPARQVARFADLPDHVRCTTVNKVCSSGMKSVSMAAQSIMLGDAEVVVAGGMESMSRVPYYAEKMRWGNKYGHVSFTDGLVRDGLADAYDGQAMGMAAELCASSCGISREDQDAYATESYHRSQDAWSAGRFLPEVVPVPVPQSKGEAIMFEKDEEPWNVKFYKIPSLNPVFKKDGSVTAANASTMNDGAAALVLVSGEMVRSQGLKPLARIVSYADAEQSPEWFTTSPSLALPLALEKAGLTVEEISRWEINEAFSVVALENARRLGLDMQTVNVNGGAVSLGHPLGCSGARIIVTLVHALKACGGRYGAAGICNGGGGASAIVIENL
jgi:acetyl-CoA C-acetyltransferase